jgi:hypothetical protein
MLTQLIPTKARHDIPIELSQFEVWDTLIFRREPPLLESSIYYWGRLGC